MDREKLKHFENRLLERKKELEEYLASIEEKFSLSQRDSSSDLSAQPTHVADLAADSEIREEEACFIDSATDELRKVNKALEKIHSNTYGYCEKCRCKIGIERLEAIPQVGLCIKCGSKL